MKKLVYLASAMMMFALTACNKELGPEYTTVPTVSNLTVTPLIAPFADDGKDETVIEGQSVTLSCDFTNQYGRSAIYMCYRTLSAEEYEGLSEYSLEMKWLELFSSTDEKYKGMDNVQVIEAPVENLHFTSIIPGQPAGTKVRWDFGFYNEYGLGTGYLFYRKLPQYEYTVAAGEPGTVEPIE